MAASSKIRVGGYQCECVENVSEYYVCAFCKYVAKEPHVASCCSETFCKACITPVLEDKKPCPYCETVGFTTLFNVKYEKQILVLELRCAMKDRGCEWTGRLEGLEAHLDVNTGDCEYVDVECPNRCDQPVERRNLHTHLIDSCPKREFTCQYCKFKATYEVVSNDHWPQCSFYPVPCPNACGIQAVERGDLEAHLQQCPLEKVECDFSHAGCNTKLPRQDLERHMEESTQRHLVLMSAMCARISREFEQKLYKQRDEFERQVQEQQQEIKARDEQIAAVKQQFERKQQESEGKMKALEEKGQRDLQKTTQEYKRKLTSQTRVVEEQIQTKTQEIEAKIRGLQQQLQKKAQQIEVLTSQSRVVEEQIQTKTQKIEAKIRGLQQQLQEKAQQIEVLEKYSIAPLCLAEFPTTLTVRNLSAENPSHYTQPLYTHPRGYKFRFRIFTDYSILHVLFGQPQQLTNIKVYTAFLKGEFDGYLKWPVKFTITLQLIDQQSNEDHITVTETYKRDELSQLEDSYEISRLSINNNPQRYIKDKRALLKILEVTLQSLV